jgi:two-component system chemotaxis sensor kinase CheA
MTVIDMQQFHGAFLDESAEHLDEIEQVLMDFDNGQQDSEGLNQIFRAAHSVKGGAGIFGFDALISVTHIMENLFDKARKGEYQLTPPVINELLTVVDALRQLLDSYREGAPVNWGLVAESTKKIELLLQPETPAAPTEIEGFGLFTDEAAAVEDDEDGFGFFAPLPAATTKDNDESFGFFTDAPGIVSSAAEGTAQSPTSPAVATVADAAATTPAAELSAPSTTSPTTTKAKSDSEKAENNSIRVDLHKIDGLVNLVGELVITQSMLSLIGQDVQGAAGEKLQTALVELERNTRDLQESIMSIRMLPVSFVFNRFPRVVRDLSQKLNKTVELVIEGGHTEIDKGLIEKLVDPLTHLVRNSLDHGIEAPDVRQANGKPATGHLTLRAEQKGGNILITVRDDGGGLNRLKILAKARERGIDIDENAADEEVWQLIMAPGFSTAEQITDVSGRGVGMDVVKRNIESLGGKISIQSEAGQGTAIFIRLPLTLAILDGMSVSAGGQTYIVPLVNIVESIQPDSSNLTMIGNQRLLFLRDCYWPLVYLHLAMGLSEQAADPTQSILVLVEASRSRYAIVVDELVGQQQVVIKSLEQHFRRVSGIAGATIMGDGSVALILDIESLQHSAIKQGKTGVPDGCI